MNIIYLLGAFLFGGFLITLIVDYIREWRKK